jgi:mRNA-degrading endonuclease RelE of RelBE toxin-antitoxin system
MAYDICFQGGFETVFETLDNDATSELCQKLNRVASSEWRSPTDWNYSPWSGRFDGKYEWGSYRVFADIDESAGVIVVYEARHRENLYR